MTNELATTTGTKLLGRLGEKYGVDTDKVLELLRDSVFTPGKGDSAFTNNEIQAALIIAERYNLDPFAKQIYLIRSKGKLIPIVPVDGWTALVNSQATYEGCSFEWTEDDKGGLKSCTCTIHRSDRKYPTVVEEFLGECTRNTEPWQKWPRRMLRHKAFIQCARLAFSLTGVVDPDEADRYVDVHVVKPKERTLKLPEVKVSRGVTAITPAPEQREVTPSDDETEKTEVAGVQDYEKKLRQSFLAAADGEVTDPEREGLVKSFGELWRQHVNQGLEPAELYGVGEGTAEISTQDLGDLVAMMSDTVTSEASRSVEA